MFSSDGNAYPYALSKKNIFFYFYLKVGSSMNPEEAKKDKKLMDPTKRK